MNVGSQQEGKVSDDQPKIQFMVMSINRDMLSVDMLANLNIEDEITRCILHIERERV